MDNCGRSLGAGVNEATLFVVAAWGKGILVAGWGLLAGVCGSLYDVAAWEMGVSVVGVDGEGG